MEKLIKKYKDLLMPTAVSAVLILLIVFSANYLISQVTATTSEAAALSVKVETLRERIATLENSAESVRDSVNVAALAIPEKNPSVLVARQLRELAAERGVTLSEFSILSTDAQTEEGIFTYEVNFDVEGPDYESVSGFVGELDTLLPLVNLGNLAMKTGSVGGVEAQVRLLAYSAHYPANLPSLDDPISGLSPAQEEMLAQLSGFNSPAVGGVVTQTETEIIQRPNPFSL